MTMHLRLNIPSGSVYETVTVTNEGSPSRAVLDPDLRTYRVSWGSGQDFIVEHRRSDGRWSLASTVYAELAKRNVG